MLLIITTEFPPYPGGIATYSYQIAAKLTAMGIPLQVLATLRPASDQYDDPARFDRSLVFPVHRFPNSPVRLLRLILRTCYTVLFCWRRRPAAIYCCTLASAYGAFLCKLLMGVPYFLVGIGSEYTGKSRFSALVLNRASKLLAISHYTASLMKGCADIPVTVIPLGADTERFVPHPAGIREQKARALKSKYGIDGAPILLSVGRLNARKGHDITLRALLRVREAYPGVHLVIIGRSTEDGGYYEAELRSFIKSAGIEGNVHLISMVTPAELPLFYEMADVFILASRSDGGNVEGFGIVLIEANLMKTAVVASRTGGVVDAVEDGKSGLLFECENPLDLAHKILLLLDNDKLRQALGEYGRERALRKHNWHVVASRTWQEIKLCTCAPWTRGISSDSIADEISEVDDDI